MAKILSNKKKSYQEVNTNVMQRTLDYVTEKYGLTSDYTVVGFKLGKSGIEIKVKNIDVECTYLIVSSKVIAELTKSEEDDEE